MRGYVTVRVRNIDGEIQDAIKIAQTFSEQARTDMFVPGFMATYCQAGSAKSPEAITDRSSGQVKTRGRSESVAMTNS